MNRQSLLRKSAVIAAAAVAIATGGLVVGTSAASADPIGTLTFTGLTNQTSGFTVRTSGGCPAPATNFVIKVTGGNLPATPTFITGNTAGSTVSGGINAGPFTGTPQYTLEVFAGFNGLAKLGDGTYTTTVVCRTALASASLGDFVGTFTVSNSGATVTPTVPVSAADTSTTLSTLPVTSANWGAPVALTATVANTTAPTGAKPTGTVQFKDGGTNLGSPVAVNAAGVAATSVGTLGEGAHTLSAVYAPTGAFNASASAGVVLTVALGAPTLVRAPSLGGVARVGGVLSCSSGTWSGAGSYTYEFLRNGSVVQNSGTTFTRTLAPADLGASFACRVTGINPIGSLSSTTAALKVTAGAASVATVRPKIVGTVKTGKTVLAFRGTWSPAATSYTYLWKSGSKTLRSGSTATSYKIPMSLKGKTIVLYVYAARTGYLTGLASSVAVKVK